MNERDTVAIRREPCLGIRHVCRVRIERDERSIRRYRGKERIGMSTQTERAIQDSIAAMRSKHTHDSVP